MIFRLHCHRDWAGRFTRWILSCDGDIVGRQAGQTQFHQHLAPVVELRRG
jgi:hypothetical protein